jgi:hypothetical protein
LVKTCVIHAILAEKLKAEIRYNPDDSRRYVTGNGGSDKNPVALNADRQWEGGFVTLGDLGRSVASAAFMRVVAGRVLVAMRSVTW